MSDEIAVIGPEINPAFPSNPANRFIEMAISSNADIDKLSKLMEMQFAWEKRNAQRDFLDAMSRFQSMCPDIKKLKQGHNYKYAPLSDIVAQTKELIAQCGLSYRFEQLQENGVITITCIVSHVAGHSVSTTLSSPPETSGSKNAIQAIGSAVQYLMRYTFICAFGITTADEDMDGRLPQKPAEPEPQFDPLESIERSLKKQGKSETEFMVWAAKQINRKDPTRVILGVEDLTQGELMQFARKLEAEK